MVMFLVSMEIFFSDSKPNIFFIIFSNTILFYHKDSDIFEIFYSSVKVLVDVSVKEIREESGLSLERSLEVPGNKKCTFLAILEKSKKSKDRPSITKSVKKPSNGKEKSSVAIMGKFKEDKSELDISKSMKKPGGKKRIYVIVLAKYDYSKSSSGVN